MTTQMVMQRRNMLLMALLAIAIAAGMLLYGGIASGDDDDDDDDERFSGSKRTYEISITNITKGQILSPAVVAAHKSSLKPIFELGYPASPELAGLAEDAALDPFVAMLEASPAVAAVEVLTGAGGPIMPGETATLKISASSRATELSLATMLVTTNDTFAALNGVRLPTWREQHFYSPGYDAGSEVNNEDCSYIPGPPCGNGGVRATDGAEGYVYIGNGVHGIGDLDASTFDWNNDVAKISVSRVRN